MYRLDFVKKASQYVPRNLRLRSIVIALILLNNFKNAAAQTTATDISGAPRVLPGMGLKQYDFFYAGEDKARKMYIVKGGKVVWSYQDTIGNGEISDAVLMANGNILFAHQYGITLINRDKKTLWSYKTPAGFETHTAQLIGPDHVIFVQNGHPAKVIVMNIKDNTITKEFEIPAEKDVHGQVRHARLTDAGNYLIAHMGLGRVCEYDSDGKPLLSIDIPKVWSAVPLKNGNILATNNEAFVKEFTRNGDVVWEYRLDQIPGYKFTNPQLSVRLSNGNTLINNWITQWDRQYLNGRNIPVQAIEVTPGKKIVWALRTWGEPLNIGPSTTIQLLNEPNITEHVHFGDIK